MNIQNNKYLLIIFTVLFSACSKPEFKESIDSNFQTKNLQGVVKNIVSSDRYSLHYISLGNKKGTPVVMVHGTPGSWDTYKYILGNSKLQKDFNLISIDRLNWGQSISSAEENPESFKAQVESIVAMIKHATDQPVILVGHSLGASIVPKITIEHPELVYGLVVLAGSLDPNLGEPRWYNKVAGLPFIHYLMPESLNKANKEITALQAGLSSYENKWQQINIPVTVIQGKKDKLVSPKNADFAKSKLNHLGNKLRIIELESMGHFLPWEKTELILP